MQRFRPDADARGPGPGVQQHDEVAAAPPHPMFRRRCSLFVRRTHVRTEKWDKAKHHRDNYAAAGFVADPNQGHGRHKETGISVTEERVQDADDAQGQLDDDLRRALGKQSLVHGKAAPKRPTDRQRRIIGELQKAHGDDVRGMMLDHKRNKMQLSEAVLTELIRACAYWPKGSGVDFRVPHKSLGKFV